MTSLPPSGDVVGAGRFAPSPTSDLHVGNLRTALLAWLFARHSGRRFLVRIEDLDVTRVAHDPAIARRQLDDLQALGLEWDDAVVRQSERIELYEAAIRLLDADPGTYPCFCTRREIAEAASAPHGAPGAYPGTCRDLSPAERRARAAGRPAALRVRADGSTVRVVDELAGPVEGLVDDFVLRRNDGAHAYNLAVVVDDIAQGVDQVVRGDDLLPSTPRQAWLTSRLGGRVPTYAHVPLVLNAAGRRLAKRDGAVTLADLAARGVGPDAVRSRLACSLGLAEAGEPVPMAVLLDRFDPGSLPREPWVWTDQEASRMSTT
ncbi:glutamyl-tRNA synthetase [Raineyella antarctica]|uniref:Glutamyl-Q tRNA(Asp) synthetase n=1 Tax=Raineyella antarctica TaxID=1577474 RepID=A0A1G6GU94_9ACTN|nr:tRNA glutamyl-Q(34) synthetase GluQRS [Raineyella antarctica]SDB84696.1 glutamyl-tRNA synthetase [Raineyella antarctica]